MHSTHVSYRNVDTTEHIEITWELPYIYRPRMWYDVRSHRHVSVCTEGVPQVARRPGMKYPPPSARTRVPPARHGLPPAPRIGSTASSCYAAGRMPLAFTQEDFLVGKLSFYLEPVAVAEWRAHLLTVREVSRSNPSNLPLLQT